MVNPKCKVGFNTHFWHPELSNIGECEIGDGCIIHSHVWIGDGVKIGNHVRIQAFAFIPPGVTIEDGAFIGPRATFLNDKHPPSDDWQETLVKQGARIGGGAVILPGVIIGEFALVGAGAVVTADVPQLTTVVGSPARVLQ